MKIGMLGFGTVGQATVNTLRNNADEHTRRFAEPVELVAVATRTPAKTAGQVANTCRVSNNILDVVNDPEVQVVVELMGGIDDARTAILAAIENGKHIVTANKALLAAHGNEIFRRAKARGCIVAFEGAVCVAIPIIKIMRESMSANRIESIIGIVNGTSNFILTKMREAGLSYETAVAEAQRLGFAEADPSFDVNGNDAAHKITILASLAFGVPLNLDAVHMTGIAKVHIEDIKYVETLGYRIKLLACAKRTEKGLFVSVEPTLVPLGHMLASVNGEMNGIHVVGNIAGPSFYYGAGAGGMATSSAIVGDILEIGRLQHGKSAQFVPLNGFAAEPVAASYIDPDAVVTPRYLRFSVTDSVGVLASISSELAKAGISVDIIHQDVPKDGLANVLVMTHDVALGALNDALKSLQKFNSTHFDIVSLPVLVG